MSLAGLQIFGTKKCPETRRAERFFRDRRIPYHFVDLAEKGMSGGELRNVASRVGGLENLIDREGKRYHDQGMQYRAPTGPRVEQALVDDPLLLRTPIVRCQGGATVGPAADAWQAWLVDGR